MNNEHQIKNEVQAAFDQYLNVYFKQRNAEGIFSMLGDEMSAIGTAFDEIAFNIGLAKKIYLRDLLQVPNPIDYTIHNINVQILAETAGLVTAVVSIKTEIGASLLEMKGLRLSMVFKKTSGQWLIVHKHISLPAYDTVEGESFPLEDLKKRNLWLENKIREKTEDLITANLQLEQDIAEQKETESKLKETEEKLSIAIDQSHLAYWECDLATGTFTFKDRFYELYGTTAAWEGGYKMLASDYCQNFLIHEDQQKVPNDISRLLLDEIDNLELEHRIVRRDGEIRNIIVRTSFVRDTNGRIVGTRGSNQDITEMALAKEALRNSDAALRELNATKDKFFSIIAHDLRGPLAGLMGLAQIMAEDLPSLTMAEIQEIAVDMKNSATNLYGLLENLLNWARMQKGQILFIPETMLLLPLVDDSVATLRESAKNKGIKIDCDVPENLEVFAEKNIVQTIVRNLVSNAIKFTNRGGDVRISAILGAVGMVQIAIRDSGIGMDREMVGNLFRIDIKTNRNGTEGELSTGLGLLLCKEFVEKQGGFIWVESDPEGKSGEKGSVFYFTLPTLST